MNNIINDVSTLTTIPVQSLEELVHLSSVCICDAIEEDKLKNKDICEIDIGIGTLYILISNESTKYKFIPNKELETNINTTIRKGVNPMTRLVESTLVDKIINTYKDLI